MATEGKISPKDWDEYEYDISVSVNNNGNLVQLKPVQIQSLLIEKDYDKSNLPVVVLSISEASTSVSVTNKTEFIISIDRFIAVKNKKGEIKQKKNKSNVLRDIFSPIEPDTTTSGNDLSDVAAKEKKTKKDELTPEDLTTKSTYTLFRKSDLTASKYIYNDILKDVTITDAIALLLSKAGVSKVLMTNLDNTNKISELLCLPIGLIQQLNYLKNYYGWHKEDSMIFMDFDVTYIIRMNGKCTAWRQGEPKLVTFYIDTVTKGDNAKAGMTQKGSDMYVNVGANNYLQEDLTSVVEQTTGTNTIIVNEDKGSVSTINGTATNTLSKSGSTTIKTTTGHNAYLKDWVKYRSKEQSGVITLTCDNIDFFLLTPNKEYRLAAGKSKIAKDVKGTYRLSSAITTFGKDGNSFSSKTNVTLKKSIG